MVLNLGLIFQIKDDLFDYTNRRIGKPTAIDIKNQKITLPLIYTLTMLIFQIKNLLLIHIRRRAGLEGIKNKIYEIINENGGFKYTFDKMTSLKEKNLLIISHFPKIVLENH